MTKNKSVSPSAREKLKRERILQATLACIERFGVEKTTFDDVTQASGMSRMSVYRVFRTRADLLDALVVERLKSLMHKITTVVDSASTFEDAIIYGSIKSIELTKEDEILFSLIENTHNQSVDRLLIDPGTPVEKMIDDVWGNIFSKARKQKILREDQTNSELLTWLRSIHLLLFLRDDLDVQGQISFISKYALPAMLNQNK